MFRRSSLVIVAAVTLGVVLTGCTTPADDDTTSGGQTRPTPLFSATAVPSVADIDLDAWGAASIPGDLERRGGVLQPTRTMDPVDVSQDDGAWQLDVVCAADSPSVARVTLSVDGDAATSELECGVGPADATSILTLDYPSGATVTVTLAADVVTAYVVAQRGL